LGRPVWRLFGGGLPSYISRQKSENKKVRRGKSHNRLYLQDSKFGASFPHFGENSILCGIRWFGGIGKNFRLTEIGVTEKPRRHAGCELCRGPSATPQDDPPASPTGAESETTSVQRTTKIQPVANCQNSNCLTQGGHPSSELPGLFDREENTARSKAPLKPNNGLEWATHPQNSYLTTTENPLPYGCG